MHTSKLRKWIKRVAIAGVVVVVIGMIALEILRIIAFQRGVESVPLPNPSEIVQLAAGADYTDAYSVPIAADVTLDSTNFGPASTVVAYTPNEVVWEGPAPGLRFLASYHISEEPARRLSLSTAVFYKSIVGRVYFFPVRYVHRRAVPFVLSSQYGGDR